MNIYTSYFANLKNIDKSKYKAIAICLKSPHWFNGSEYQVIAPTRKTFHQKNDEDYITSFNNQLKLLNPETVINDLKRVSTDKDIVLLCYEKPSDFCHRHLVANWLNKELDLNIKELQSNFKVKRKDETISLF